MPEAVVRVVDVYPYRHGPNRGAEFLLFKRAAGTLYGGQWRMVGGKIHAGESAWQAGLRETLEETGQTPRVFWSIPSVNAFYEWSHDRINLIPAFAAELDADPVLDREHDGFAWLHAPEAASRLAWPEQRRLLLLADHLIRDGVPPECYVTEGGPTDGRRSEYPTE